MKKRQHKLDAFRKASISKPQRKAVKGGYKYGPVNTGFYGSYIWENIDIRSQSKGEDQSEMKPSRTGIDR